jgi:hypothetical protein
MRRKRMRGCMSGSAGWSINNVAPRTNVAPAKAGAQACMRYWNTRHLGSRLRGNDATQQSTANCAAAIG